MWKRVGVFLVILFFVLLSDAVLSDWVPGYLQGVLGSPLRMGLMMAVSSAVGFLMDIIFPHVLRQSGVRKLAGGAIVGAMIFLLSMFSSTWWSYTLILAMGMSAWGIYYELDSFMTQQFVAGVAPRGERASVWGVVGVVRSLAYFLGPIIGGYIVAYGDRVLVVSSVSVLLLAYILFLSMRLPRSAEIDFDVHGINIKEELIHWISLGKRVWPILVISLVAGLIDSTFWTTGTMIDGWFLSAYMLPFLFVGLLMTRWGVTQGKKKWAERFVMLGGACLAIIPLVDQQAWRLLCAFGAGTFLAMAWPLMDSVYTDLVVRARRGRKHIMGMSAATFSLAYIVGPIASGWLAGKYSEVTVFSVVGIGVVLVTLMLLLVTPRKLLLPQDEMSSWE